MKIENVSFPEETRQLHIDVKELEASLEWMRDVIPLDGDIGSEAHRRLYDIASTVVEMKYAVFGKIEFEDGTIVSGDDVDEDLIELLEEYVNREEQCVTNN